MCKLVIHVEALNLHRRERQQTLLSFTLSSFNTVGMHRQDSQQIRVFLAKLVLRERGLQMLAHVQHIHYTSTVVLASRFYLNTQLQHRAGCPKRKKWDYW